MNDQETTPAEREKRIAALEKEQSLYRAMGGAWGGLSRIAKEAEKTHASDPAKLRKLVREAQGFIGRLEAALGVRGVQPKARRGDTVLRFLIGQPDDLAAGLRAWSASVEVSFQDGFEVDADVAEAIRSTLADCADGYCRTGAEVDAEVEADKKMDAENPGC